MSEVWQVERAPLERGFPVLRKTPVGAQGEEMRVAAEEVRILPVETHLSAAVCILPAERPALGQIVGDIERADVTLLKELDAVALRIDLVRRWEVVEVRVLGQQIESVVPNRTIREAEHRLRVATVVELAQRAVAE